jgi:hypothetical protein
MHHQCRLLVRRFYRYEAHRWTPNRLADRLGVGRVMLVAFYISFHIVSRQNEPNFVWLSARCRASMYILSLNQWLFWRSEAEPALPMSSPFGA